VSVRPIHNIKSLGFDPDAAERTSDAFAEYAQRENIDHDAQRASENLTFTIIIAAFVGGMVVAWALLAIGLWLVGVLS
jgi:hypothetical protein